MPEKRSPVKRRLAPAVPIELEFEDGEKLSFKLAFDMNVLARIVEKTGLKLLDTREIWNNLDARVLGAVFWAAATVHQPELDDEQGLLAMRSFVNPGNMDQVFEALWQAYLLFLPLRQREAMKKAREEALARQAEENPQTPATTTQATPAEESSTPKTSSSGSGPSPDTISASAMANSAS